MHQILILRLNDCTHVQHLLKTKSLDLSRTIFYQKSGFFGLAKISSKFSQNNMWFFILRWNVISHVDIWNLSLTPVIRCDLWVSLLPTFCLCHQFVHFIPNMDSVPFLCSGGYQTCECLAVSHKEAQIKDVQIFSERSAWTGPDHVGRASPLISCAGVMKIRIQ